MFGNYRSACLLIACSGFAFGALAAPALRC
jgi:hypothetical protein